MRRKTLATVGGLKPILVDYLLCGWDAVCDRDDAWDLFDTTPEDEGHLWRTHRDALLREARRRRLDVEALMQRHDRTLPKER